VPEDRRPALIGFEHSREDPHRGGLPGPVGTEEAEDRPRGHGEIDAIEGDHVAEPLLEPLDLDRSVGHDRTLPQIVESCQPSIRSDD
jgi:hypothetical protein